MAGSEFRQVTVTLAYSLRGLAHASHLFLTMKPQAAALDRAILNRVVGLFAPYKKEVAITGIAVLIGVVLGVVPPLLTQVLIDQGLQQKKLDVIVLYTFFILFSVLGGAGFTLGYGYMSVVMGQKIMCDMRMRLFSHLQSMSLRFFTGTRTGEIQTRLINDVAGVQNVVSNTITDQVSNIAIVIATLVVMVIMDWRLTILSIAMVPFFLLIGKSVGEYARDVRKGTQEQTSELNSMTQETLSISGILLTKTSGRLDTLTNKYSEENQKLATWQIKASVIQYLFFGLIRLITQLAPTLVYWLAGWLLIKQGDTSITVGKLVAFSGLQVRLFFPMTGLLSAQVEIMGSFALFQRIFEYMDLPRDVEESPNAISMPPSSVVGSVEFKNVEFSYEEGAQPPTISGISFKAEPGQLVALVGPSGAGKTTLTYLIPRLYDVDAGQILLDGHDIKSLKLADLGAIVGAVTQETYLLHTTIRENLKIAKPDVNEEEIIAACKSAAIYDTIAAMPDGFDTVVGERGYRMSGGEKQRLAIARAILKNPRILILDEATSALDTHSERLIQASLGELMKGRTTFAIAHRLSTVLAADQILVLQNGRIVENGQHADLVALGGLYSRLYQEQFDAPAAMVDEAAVPTTSA